MTVIANNNPAASALYNPNPNPYNASNRNQTLTSHPGIFTTADVSIFRSPATGRTVSSSCIVYDVVAC